MFFLIFSVQVLITSFEPSIADVESLALRESSEIRIASEELESAKAEYKAALLSFVPSIKTTAYVPSISYYSDEIYYPSYPYPIDYWKRKEEKLIITELSLSLPFGGDATVSYDLMKVGEFYNLYGDREYYEGNITFNLSQPIFGTSVLWDRIKQLRRGVGKKARELKKVKRDVKREVRRDIVSIFISEKTLEGINEMGELAERGLQELDFLRKKGVIDENEHLISKGKLGRFLLKKMEIEEDLRENKERLKLLTGLSDFSAAEIPIPDFSGESVPDIVFDLLTIRDDIMSIDDEISRKKRLFYPSFEVS
ncbi:TolC family protein, partial [candidate division WOR-3 bacterium]|nr:TolC family protein [candidate division WOR-3 bacterium]